MRFDLRKWYLDCTTHEGATLIGYVARLRWGWIGFDYGAVLLALPGEPVRQAQTLRGGKLVCAKDSIIWRHPRLHISGLWADGSGHEPVRLYQGDLGAIDWQCLAANARACVRLPDGRELQGRGYAESLRLTVPPWRLPFDELRWGRFIGDSGATHRVWIDWRGGLDRRWIWAEDGMRSSLDETGAPQSALSIGDDCVSDARGTLSLGQSRTLRDAPLAASLLGPARGLAGLLPGNLLRAREAKWLSRGVLRSGPSNEEGWAIHEVVRWR